MTTAGTDKSQIEEIKERIAIEDVVKRYVKLKPVGKNLFGLCPFHTEKSPSFSVNPELNIFKCYGCGEGGDVFTFLQKIESLEFPEALELLAKEAGVTLTRRKTSPEQTDRYDKAKRAHELAAQYYNYLLTKHASGADARSYLTQRGLSDKAVETYRIGYAPAYTHTNSLLKFLAQQSFTPEQLEMFGLASVRAGRIGDKFVDRIMFPIFDPAGHIIAFSGRVFRPSDDRPKYLNSPETILFQKRRNLYGLYQAKADIKKQDRVIVVEGQTDTIASWQVGVSNVVAPLGTGFTDDQLTRLARYTHTLAIAFDSDTAGEIAHARTAMMGYRQGFNVMSIAIPYGKDADECIRHDPALWKKAAETKIPAISHFIQVYAKRYNIKTLDGKQRLLRELAPLFRSVRDPVSRNHHINELHLLTDIPIEVLDEKIVAADDESVLKPIQTIDTPERQSAKPSSVSSETYLLTLLLQFPEIMGWASEKIPLNDFLSPLVRDAAELLISSYKTENSVNLKQLFTLMRDDTRSLCTDLLMQPVWTSVPSGDELSTEITTAIRNVKRTSAHREVSELKKTLALAEQAGDTRQANEILNTISAKIKEIEVLSNSSD